MQKDGVSLRRINDSEKDYRLLEKWYQEKEVYKYFEQRKFTYEEVKNKYYPRTKDTSNVVVYMIEYESNPIGIIQYQLIDKENKKLYNIEEDNSYEIDIFIGELSHHNKGIGRISVNLIAEYLFKDKKAEIIAMCPLKENINAIKCYEHCGFKIVNETETKDTIGKLQKYVLMIRKNK